MVVVVKDMVASIASAAAVDERKRENFEDKMHN